MVSFHQVRSLDSSALKSNELERLAYPNTERGGCFKLGAASYVFFSLAVWRMTSNFQHHKLQCEAAGYVRPSVANLWTIKGVSALSDCVNWQGAWFLTPTHITSTIDFWFALLTCAQWSQQRCALFLICELIFIYCLGVGSDGFLCVNVLFVLFNDILFNWSALKLNLD